MGINSVLLCIHPDPAQLRLLAQNGFNLVTATHGHDGLRRFMSQPVDVVVLDYGVGPGNGAGVADEIRKVNPQVPILLLGGQEGSACCVEIRGCPGRQFRGLSMLAGDCSQPSEREAGPGLG